MQSSWIYPGHQFQTQPSALAVGDQHEKQQTQPRADPGNGPSTEWSLCELCSHCHQHSALDRQAGALGISPANPVPPVPTDKRIYRLPVFTEQFCQALVDELENFEQSDMPKGRPNTMNNYGVRLILVRP